MFLLFLLFLLANDHGYKMIHLISDNSDIGDIVDSSDFGDIGDSNKKGIHTLIFCRLKGLY